jgi:hypothetical protein
MPNTCENRTPRPSRDLGNTFDTSDKKELLKNIGLRMLKCCHDCKTRVIRRILQHCLGFYSCLVWSGFVG